MDTVSSSIETSNSNSLENANSLIFNKKKVASSTNKQNSQNNSIKQNNQNIITNNNLVNNLSNSNNNLNNTSDNLKPNLPDNKDNYKLLSFTNLTLQTGVRLDEPGSDLYEITRRFRPIMKDNVPKQEYGVRKINQNNTLSSDLRVIDANQIKTIEYTPEDSNKIITEYINSEDRISDFTANKLSNPEILKPNTNSFGP